MHTTSISLLERLRQPGAQASWTRFVELYTPLLFYWARRLGLQESDAADLVQDVFALLVRRLPEFAYDRQKSFRNYLRTILRNKWRENLRRLEPATGRDPQTLEQIADNDEFTALEEAEYRQQLVQQALRVLQPEFPSTTWKAFQEYVVAGRDPAQVAAELQISIGRVYTAKSRVLSRVRQELDGLLD